MSEKTTGAQRIPEPEAEYLFAEQEQLAYLQAEWDGRAQSKDGDREAHAEHLSIVR